MPAKTRPQQRIDSILFTITVILNVWAAPDPAIIDLAPICCLWILMVYIQTLRSMRTISEEINL